MVINLMTKLTERLDRAVSRLMAVRVDGDRVRVSVPVLYPSGSSSAVEIVINGEQCFVSDLGLGQTEAEMNGASNFYDHAARKSVERFGVGYDGLSVFAIWASLDKIESAILAVSNASVAAAAGAIYSAIDEKEKHKNDELFERVRHIFSHSQIFGHSDVSKQQEIIGRDAVWPAHNVVTLPNNRKVIFEFVSESQNSIAAKFMMFSDLARVEKYSLNSVVRSIEKIGKKGAMLADVSHVMQLEAGDNEYIERAIAS